MALSLAACGIFSSDPQDLTWMSHAIGTVPATGL
jgi:hypothetical protein